MTTAFALQTILEILAVLFVVYGILNEKKFVAFENKVCRYIKRRIILHKRRKARKTARVNKTTAKTPQRRENIQVKSNNIYATQFVA